MKALNNIFLTLILAPLILGSCNKYPEPECSIPDTVRLTGKRIIDTFVMKYAQYIADGGDTVSLDENALLRTRNENVLQDSTTIC